MQLKGRSSILDLASSDSPVDLSQVCQRNAIEDARVFDAASAACLAVILCSFASEVIDSCADFSIGRILFQN